MPLPSINNYFDTEEKHERLWKEAIVVFDTSSLLELYFYSEKTQKSIINEIFKKLKGRLWIPFQVSFEFQKNRKKVILKPIDSYKGIEQELNQINDHFKKLSPLIAELKSKTKKDDKHPYIDQDLFTSIDSSYDNHEAELKKLISAVRTVVKSKSEFIKSTVKNDSLLIAINNYFEVGTEYSFEAMMKIVEEGKKRYEFKIPPGYEDGLGKGKKDGIQIFGDLILWKEILDYSKKKGKPIIFISNDLKPDWCYREKDAPRVERPREELIKEILDFSGVEFWMYSNSQLLFYSKKFLNSLIDKEQIKEVADLTDINLLNKEPSCIFTWPVNDNTSNGDSPFSKSLMYLIGVNGKALFIDWGDGSPLEESNTTYSVRHTYPSSGDYTVRIYGDIFWYCAMGIGAEYPKRWFQYPKVSELTLSPSLFLDRLQSMYGSLRELNVSHLLNLSQLLISGNQIETLDLSKLSKLSLLFCSDNLLTKLELSNNKLLKTLECNGNQLTSLDIKSNNNITSLNCSNNRIKDIYINNNSKLLDIDCSRNQLDANSLNNIFNNLPNSEDGKIKIQTNIGSEHCNRSIAELKGWKFI